MKKNKRFVVDNLPLVFPAQNIVLYTVQKGVKYSSLIDYEILEFYDTGITMKLSNPQITLEYFKLKS